MKKIFVFSATCALLATLAAPASAQSREQRQMMASLQILQEQAQQLTIAIATLQRNLDASVQSLNARLDKVADDARRGFADQKLLIDAAASDVRVVRERGDDTNVRIAALREELEALRQSVLAIPIQQAAPAGVDPAAPVDPNATAGAPGAPVAPPPTAPAISTLPSTAGLSPTRMYETARADYFAGQYSVAVTGFEQFLKAFPRSELADDAQFHIGEAYYTQSRWPEAIAAYNQVIQTYPGTNSVPDALYKRGLAQERLGQPEAARASWDAAVNGYPDSDAGRLARQSLDRLGARRP
jgi:tol-pal system protein YbgF